MRLHNSIIILLLAIASFTQAQQDKAIGYQERLEDLSRENRELKEAYTELKQEALSLNTIILICVVAFLVITTIYVRFLIKRKKQKEEIKRFREMAQRARRTLAEREKFLAYTNHEIRTPLNAVSGSAELLAKTELSPVQEKYVNTIKASVDNVLVLVNDVLDLSRIESGNIEFMNADFMLTDVINGVGYILQEKVDKKGIQFITEIDREIPPVIKGDSRYLNQILINLANNAVKFTDLGSVTLKARKVVDAGSKIRIRFEIVDTGKGIRKSKLPTIFNQFEQETRHTIKHGGGSGLGLAITKQLVEAQGGVIGVDSKYLEGTTFYVEMEFEKSQAKTILSKNVSTGVLDNLRILVVDDNDLNREILTDVLHGLNSSAKIKAVEDGNACIRDLGENDYDIVLMDIQMPNMDGYETTEYIRKNTRAPMNEVPVIAMTAYAMDNVAEKCFSAGMNDFITKPVDSRFLLTKIERILEKSGNARAAEIRFEFSNLGNLKRLTAGDNTKMLKYIDLFLKNAPADIESLEKAVETGNWKEAEQHLHKLKGNCAYMGNLEVGKIYDSINSENNFSDSGLVEAYASALKQAKGCMREVKNLRTNFKMLFLDHK